MMYCEQCGRQIIEGVAYCRYCGKKINLDINKYFQKIICKDHITPLKTPSAIGESPKDIKSDGIFSGVGCLSFFVIVIAGAFAKSIGKSLINDPVAYLYITHLGGGLLGGAICGLLPLCISHKWENDLKYHRSVFWGSFLVCTTAGFIGGLIFSVPSSVSLAIIIWYLVFGIWYLVFGIWYLVFGKEEQEGTD